MVNANLKSRLGVKVKAITGTEAETSETALVPVGSNYLALTGNALNIIQENLKHQPLSLQFFDIIKSPSGGATVFSVPGLTGDEPAKELTGIILDYTTPRAYWDTPDPVEGTPPVCFSADSLISSEGKPCSQCPFNTFGSKGSDSNAKACKESVVLFMLRPDNIMPIVVRIPVTSKSVFLKYLTRLIGKMIPLSGVVTKITLEKATSRGGKPYALYKFEAAKVLDPEEAAQAKVFGKSFMEIVNASKIEQSLSEAS